MKRFTFLLLILGFLSAKGLFSSVGDTLEVRTIEFQETRQGWFDFPSEETQIEKIMMNYKLRCPPGKPCGEWDYIVNLFVREYYAPNYQFAGRSLDTSFYMTSPGWKYTPIYEDDLVVDLDSSQTDPIWLYYFDIESETPTKAIDSQQVWQRYYMNYVIQDGQIVDSTLSEPDEFITLEKKRVYFNDNVTIFDQIEIFRYITPYGNGLDLGEGFNWILELSDFRPYLTGKVFLYAPSSPSWIGPLSQNVYEDLELTFDFIEGIPERDILNIDHLWSKTVLYNKNYENEFPEFEYQFDEDVKNARFKLIQTGHGFGDDTENCAEFCQKDAFIYVNGEEIWKQNVWRECGDNPVFPQGGTWLADRTNWCPGAEVVPYDIELSEYLSDNSTMMINYDMEYFDPVRISDPSNFPGRYNTSAYIITYGELNFQYDVEILDILSPNNKDMFSRFNPTCSNPEIIFRNRGSEIINELDIRYNINGEEAIYNWTGNLAYNQIDTLVIPGISWSNRLEGNYFNVLLENPNGNIDQYSSNNDAYVEFDSIREMYDEMILEFKTVNYDAYNATSPFRYFIFDKDGQIVESRSSTQNSTKYTDTLRLDNGCYTFFFENRYGYGLSYWPLDRLSNGYLNFKKKNATLTTFNPDFGNSIYFQFVVKDHPQITTLEQIDTLDMGEVNLGEKTTKKVTIIAANDEPVILEEIDIKLGTIKGFNVINTIPEFVEGMVITKDEGIELEIEFEGKFAGVQRTDIEIKAENTFLPINTIPILGKAIDPSTIAVGVDHRLGLEVVYDKNMQPSVNYFSNINTNCRIFISDIFGNKLEEIYVGMVTSDINSKVIDKTNLSSGFYYLTLQTDHNIIREKLIISK